MDFILGLPKIQRNKDSIFVVNDATHIAELYLKEVMRLRGIP